jgi:xanthine dehydrogenase accessory factor
MDNREEGRKIKIDELVIAIKGAGEMASAVAWSLFRANIRKIFMLEIARPLAVRREVAFCEAVHVGHKTVEGVRASLCQDLQEIRSAWRNGSIAVVVDPLWQTLKQIRPDAMVDAILAKKNLGSHSQEASLTIALGPGFSAGRDVDIVIETNRGHNLGRIRGRAGDPGSSRGRHPWTHSIT